MARGPLPGHPGRALDPAHAGPRRDRRDAPASRAPSRPRDGPARAGPVPVGTTHTGGRAPPGGAPPRGGGGGGFFFFPPPRPPPPRPPPPPRAPRPPGAAPPRSLRP